MSTPILPATPAPLRRLARPEQSVFRLRVVPRLVFILPFICSVGMLWWSLASARPVMKESEDITRRTAKLSRQIEDMELRQQHLQREGVSARFSAEIGRHFESQNAIVRWLDDAREKAMTLALDLNPRFGEAENATVGQEHLVMVPLTLEVKPAAGIPSQRSAYHRVLEFTHYLAGNPKRADLQRMSLTGRNGSAAEANYQLHLWGIAPTP